MRRLIVFNQVTLDGYFTDTKGDISWAHKRDPEWDAFVQGNAQQNGEFVFGRVTYQMMASYWPTPAAMQNNPVVAERMNSSSKVVFSRTLVEVSWKNTRLLKDSPASEVRKMKNESGPGMVIFGSGTIVSQLAQEGLIDEYQLVVNPVVIGKGRTMFENVSKKLSLKRTNTRTFSNGNVFACYEPAS